MDSLNDLLTTLSCKLDRLTIAVEDLRQRTSQLSQDCVWDANMLRQQVATKHDLRGLADKLVSRQDIVRAIDVVCDRVASLRFDNHQEHQELLRFMDEGPYGCAPSRQDRRSQHDRSATSPENEVLEMEEVGAVLEPSAPAVTLVTARSADRN